MNKAVIATFSFVAGAGLGFVVGYYMNKKEQETREQEAVEAFKEYSKNSQGVDFDETRTETSDLNVKPAKFAKPDGTPGMNYTQYNKDLKKKAEAESPSDDDPDDISEDDDVMDPEDYEETYEERLERESNEYIEHAETYKKEHAGKIDLMKADDWDTDFPETDYEREDLYFFTEDGTLSDEDGKILSEEEFIGPKPRQVGWMRSPDDTIYVRNHPKQREYRVFKEHCNYADWF